MPLRSKATDSILFSLLSFIWKRQFKRRVKNEKRRDKRTKIKRQSSFENCRFFLVQLMGLEPIRLPTRPSNVRVCQFRHSCIFHFYGSASRGLNQTRKDYYTHIFPFVKHFFKKCKKISKNFFGLNKHSIFVGEWFRYRGKF